MEEVLRLRQDLEKPGVLCEEFGLVSLLREWKRCHRVQAGVCHVGCIQSCGCIQDRHIGHLGDQLEIRGLTEDVSSENRGARSGY